MPTIIQAGCPPRCQVATKTLCAHQNKASCPGRCQLVTKTPHGHQINTWCPPRCQQATKMPCAQQNKCWIPTKMPGGPKNAPCPPKEMQGAHQNNTGCPPQDTMAAHQKIMCPAKEMLSAQQDARLSQNSMYPPKNIAWCPPTFQVAPKMPGAHEKKRRLPTKINARWTPKCHVPTK